MTPDQPVIAFDEALPISAHVEEITEALRHHQVLVVAGETGSGKTTQLPKICLLAGRQRIGHTQPRRIAARSVAARMAEELGEELGRTVGFQVRFSSQRSRETRVKVMTDGILLAEISHDRDLRRYDTIIIDEAHERSLNIDFLLGYLKQLLPRRPELKVIITSATIDTARFSAHFDDAPVIEVSGRSYPVELRYRPVSATAEKLAFAKPRCNRSGSSQASSTWAAEPALIESWLPTGIESRRPLGRSAAATQTRTSPCLRNSCDDSPVMSRSRLRIGPAVASSRSSPAADAS